MSAQIRAERAASSLTQAQVYEAAGLSRSNYLRIEKGTHVVDMTELARLCDAFGLPLSEFFRRVEARLVADQPNGTRFPLKAEAADLELQLRSANEDAAQGHGEVTGSPCGGKELGND